MHGRKFHLETGRGPNFFFSKNEKKKQKKSNKKKNTEEKKKKKKTKEEESTRLRHTFFLHFISIHPSLFRSSSSSSIT